MARARNEHSLTGWTNRRRILAGTAALVGGGAISPIARAQEATPVPGGTPAAAARRFDRAAFDAVFSHHTALANGVRLHYVIGGQGDPLVLLHGWPMTWFEWRHVMPALAERYRVIAPDLRGLGDSAKPLDGYDTRTAAADIHELVRQLGHSRIFLAGHDIGGLVAYAYAAAHRDEVRRLAILDVVPPDDPILALTTLTTQGSLWHMSFHFARDLPEALIAGKERLYLSWFYRYAAYDPTAVDEEAVDEYVRCYAAEGGLRAGFEYYRAFFTDIEQTKEAARTKLEMPVLALGGAASFGDFLRQQWPNYASNVEVDVVDQAGHWIPEEQPAVLTERLLAFFGAG